MDATLRERILEHNRRLHDADGYADFYDDQLALVRNPWEQRLFRDDLARIARALPRGFSALDLGCGTGNLTLKLVDLGAAVTGVDLSAGMLERLRRKLADSGRRAQRRHRNEAAPREGPAAPEPALIAADVDTFLWDARGVFDLVCACSFLHHLPDYLATVAAAARRVAPGGCLYVVHEPLKVAHGGTMGRVLEWLDFGWQRLEARTGLGGRVARVDPYWNADNLADYWVAHGGIDARRVEAALRGAALSPRITRYDSKRHRILHVLANLLGSQHLVRFEAWRIPPAPG